MSHQICCVITGKTITVSNEYFDKKVSDFGSEEKLNSLYVSRQAKNLLKRGYSSKEIRSLLKITKQLPDISSDKVKEILKITDDDNNLDKINIKKSDPEVEEFIKNLKLIF